MVNFRGVQARSATFHDETGVAVLRAGPDHQHIRDGGIGDPHFRTIEYPTISLAFGMHLHRRHVGTCPRLCQAETSHELAGGEAREVLFLLLLRAPVVNGKHR